MLTPEEQKIVEFGKANGKTKEEIFSAVSKYRATQISTQTPQSSPQRAPETGLIAGIKQDFNTRVNNAADSQVSAMQGQQDPSSAALQTIGQGAGLVGDIASRAIGAVVPDAVKNVAGKVLQAGANLVPKPIADMGGDAVTRYADWKTAHPEAAANLEAIGNLAQLVPIGAGAAKGAQVSVKGALVGTGKALEASADAVSTTGRAVKGAGGVVYRSAVTPTVKEAERILSYQAKTPFLTRVSNTLKGKEANAPITRGQTALERGVYGTESMVGVQARRISDNLWQKEIAPAVAKSPVQMSKDDLFTTARARVAATTDPTRKQALQNALDALAEDYAKFPDSFDLTTAQALKRDLATFTPAKVFKGQEVASEVRMLQADMADAIRQKTYDSLADEGIKRKYLDWANLHELEKVGVKAISEGSFKGGSGTLVSGLWDMATVPVKTIGGQVLYRVGNKVEFVGTKNIRTLGQYLQQKGFAKPKQYDTGASVEMGAGLSMKDASGIPKGVRPDTVAKFVDKEDRNLIAKFLDNPSDPTVGIRIEPMFKAMRIEKADKATQIRFLKDVLDETSI